MADSSLDTEAILKQLFGSAQQYASDFIRDLPLRDADIAELNRALLASGPRRAELARLQQEYVRDWVAIMQGQNVEAAATADRRFSAPEWRKLAWFRFKSVSRFPE